MPPTHLYLQENYLRLVGRNRLRAHFSMALDIAVFSADSFFGESRAFFVDTASFAQRHRHFFVLEKNASSRWISSVHCSCVLLFHGVVSRLGWYFLLWKPVLRFANGFLCRGTRDFAEEGWGEVSNFAGGKRCGSFDALSFCLLEFGA